MFVSKAAVLLLFLHLATSQHCLNYLSTNESICNTIFLLLQKQIVESDANLFSLRKVFFPTSKIEPALVNVSYDLQVSVHNASSEQYNRSCPGDLESSSNPRYDRLPEGLRRLLTVHAWSSKIFYTLFHPATVNRLQPQALQWILRQLDGVYNPNSATNDVTTALTWTTTGPILTVELKIDLKLPCWPTFLALDSSLNDLTSVLKVYADTQANVSSWSAEERGHTLLGNVFYDEWWLYIALGYPTSSQLPEINVFLSIILTLMISFGVYYALWNVAPANSDEKNFLFSHSVIWTGVVTLSLANIFLLSYEFGSLFIWCTHRSCQESAAESKIGWLIWMLIFMVIAFFVLLVHFVQGKTKHRDIFTPEWRAFVIATPLFSTLPLLIVSAYKFLWRPLLKIRKIHNVCIHLQETQCCVVCIPRPVKIVLRKTVYFSGLYLIYMTVFVSLSLLSFSIVPVLLQTFLYPFRIIAAYSFFFTGFVMHFMAAFLAVFHWKKKQPSTGKLLLYLSATTIAVVTLSIISVPFISLYQLLVSRSFSENPLVLFAASLLPSILLSSPLVWLFRSKLLPRFLEVDEEEEEEGKSDVIVDEENGKKRIKRNIAVEKPREAAEELSTDPGPIYIEMETV